LLACPACNLRVKAYRQLYLSNQRVSPEIVEQGLPLTDCIDEAKPMEQSRSQNPQKRYFSYGRLAAVAVVLLCAVGLSILLADRLTRPRYYRLASVRSDRYDQIILYRERSSLLQALFLFRSGHYEKAIPAIEASIATKEGHNMRPYLRLMQGLAYLKLAESSTYGLFPRFDMNHVEAAIVTFQACIDEAGSAEMVGVRASAYIYQAKAYLMSGNARQAQQALREAIATGDELSEQARELLNNLHRDESGAS
jgi:tetratricopeptide (TPR) repeat protein